VDIGSNDGSFLAHLQEKGMQVSGDGPSNSPAKMLITMELKPCRFLSLKKLLEVLKRIRERPT
jgi:hypothetical protein